MVSAEHEPRRVGTIWLFDLDHSIPDVNPGIPVSFSRVNLESITKLAALIGENSSTDILKRFESGRRCYVAQVNEQFAAYGWVSFEEEFVGELSLHLKLLPGEAYIWDCVTLPAFRRNHLYSALLRHMLVDLRAEPLHRVWIGADLDNTPSQRGIARAGFKAVADLVLLRVAARRQAWLEGRPDVPERLVTEARRVYLNSHDKVWLDSRSSATTG